MSTSLSYDRIINVAEVGPDELRSIVRLVERRDPGPVKGEAAQSKWRNRLATILAAKNEAVAVLGAKKFLISANAVQNNGAAPESAADMVARAKGEPTQAEKPVPTAKPQQTDREKAAAKLAAQQQRKLERDKALAERQAERERRAQERAAAKQGKAEGGSEKRASAKYADTMTIHLTKVGREKPPVYREGTGRAELWSAVKDGMTMAEWNAAFERLGVRESRRIGFLRLLIEQGYVSLAGQE